MKYICTMKLLCIALSFYILALSNDTCNDIDSFGTHNSMVITSSQSHSKTGECTCSPFCHCGCCGKPIVPALSISVMPPFSVFTFGFSIYRAHPAKVTPAQIWRPPVQLT